MKKSCKKRQKRGQMQMSFGMIFSIILIVVFLGFAFYAIKIFLNFQDNAKAGRLFDSLQSDIDRVWKSSFSSEQGEYFVPSYVSFVCFVDFSSDAEGKNAALYPELKKANYGSENIVVYPVKYPESSSKELNHLNLKETTLEENPFCIEKDNGKIALMLNKDFGEALVKITKP